MRTALFTMMYPDALRYASAWKESVRAQSTHDFSIVMGLHDVRVEDVDIGELKDIPVECVEGSHSMSLRRELLQSIARRYDVVILVDADDILLPHRVEAACDGIRNADVHTCAMHVVDEQLRSCDMVFPGIDAQATPDITHGNIRGCSNTAYRADIVSQVASFPDDCILADWYMATVACDIGAQCVFDANPAMLYRVRDGAPTNPCVPYVPETLRMATELVAGHLRHMRHAPVSADMHARLQRRHEDVVTFQRAIRSDTTANSYLRALYADIPLQGVWWECVAHTMLESLWKT